MGLNFEEIHPKGKFWGLGGGRKKTCFPWLDNQSDCLAASRVSFATGLWAGAGGCKRVVFSEETGKTRAEISHLLQLSETQGRLLVSELVR